MGKHTKDSTKNAAGKPVIKDKELFDAKYL